MIQGMLQRFCFILTIILVFSLKESMAQTTIRGVLVEKDSITEIPFAYVVNKSTGTGEVASSDGLFSLSCKQTDTVIFKSLGFVNLKICVADLLKMPLYAQQNKIILYPDIIALKPFVITEPGLSKEEKQYYERFIYQPPPDISSPISLIYYKFSREGKSREKLQILYERELYLEKYMKRMLQYLRYKRVNLAGFDIADFSRYCPLTTDFVDHANNYEFFFAVNRCFQTYYGIVPTK
jgi:hypothetical protein